MRVPAVSWLICLHAAQICAAADQQVHILFSNHLDVGFKYFGSAAAVINEYFQDFFPRAAEVAEQFRAANQTDERYVWHVEGSWLPSLFLDCPGYIGAFRAAVSRGDIAWNAMPFNMQVELMDAPLLQYAVDVSHDLDRAFGLPPKVVGSQRDVPGFTRGALPSLAKAGVRVFSLGVNGGSAPWGPKNTPFLWRDEQSGAELVFFLHPGGYSGSPVDSPEECVRAAYRDGAPFEHVLCLAWKQDNQGPHTFEEAQDIFGRVRAGFPGARVRASTWETYGAALLAALPDLALPALSEEVGDTWIYGAASDVVKMCEFRALLRERSRWSPEQLALKHVKDFSRLLLKVAEHTWGADIKTYLADYDHWSNDAFREIVNSLNFQAVVVGWEEQRAYCGWAVQALGSTTEGELAHSALAGCHEEAEGFEGPEEAAVEGFQEVPLDPERLTFVSEHWTVTLDNATGGMVSLRREWEDGQGVDWGDASSPLGVLTYSTYTEADYDTIWQDYAYSTDPDVLAWFELDFGKTNCSIASPQRADTVARLAQLWVKAEEPGEDFWLRARLELPEALVEQAGAPRAVWLDLRSPADSPALQLDLLLAEKTATRLPEAAWVKFAPSLLAAEPASWRMDKLGQAVSPLEVVQNGSQLLHAVGEGGITVAAAAAATSLGGESLNIRSLDAPLVSPGAPTAFPSLSRRPDLAQGMSWNLLNNLWGTNYVEWQGFESSEPQSFRFRFEIRAEAAQCTSK